MATIQETLQQADQLSRAELRTLKGAPRQNLWSAILEALTSFANKSTYPEDLGGPTVVDFQNAGDAHVLETRFAAIETPRGPKQYWRFFGRKISRKRGARNNNY